MRAVAVTGQWAGTVAVDEHGEPLGDAMIWLDTRGAAHARRLAGGRVRVAGYDPRKLALWLRRTGGAPSLAGRDPLGHILLLRAERPELGTPPRALPRADRLAQLQALGPRRDDRRHRDAALGHRHPRRHQRPLRRRADRAGRPRPRPAARAAPAQRDARPAHRDRAGRARRAGPRTVPVVAGTPDTMSAAIGSGAVDDHAAHLYIGTSSWLSCHVPYKKTDPLHAIASLPSALPGRYLVSTEQQTAGVAFERLRDLLLPGRRRRGLRRARDGSPAQRAGPAAAASSSRRGSTASARRSTTTSSAAAAQPVAGHDARRPRPRGARGRRAQRALDAARRRALLPAASSTRSRSSAAARSRRCGRRSWPTCSSARSAASTTRCSANVRGAGLLAWLALGELRVEQLHGARADRRGARARPGRAAPPTTSSSRRSARSTDHEPTARAAGSPRTATLRHDDRPPRRDRRGAAALPRALRNVRAPARRQGGPREEVLAR